MTPAGAHAAALAAIDREELRARAVEILARPEFARARSLDAEGVEWVREIVRAAFARIADLFSWLDGVRLAQPGLYWLLVLGLSIVALGLLGHVGWSLRVALRRPAELGVAREPPPSTASLIEQAAELAAQGKYLEAAHRLELASIEALLQRGAIRLARHEANRTLRARVATAAIPLGERKAFLGLLDRFETAWFRDRTPDRELYDGWRALHERLVAEEA
jgi:hypothetical protein